MTVASSTSFSMNELCVSWKLSTHLISQLPADLHQLVICCIGSDRSTGDTLGPLVGTWLKEMHSFPLEVIGSLDQPLHALNLESTLLELQSRPIPPFIIAIDACLGRTHDIGTIIIENGPLLPGRAVQKELPPIGDLSIKGIVNVSGYMEYAVLQSTRLHTPFQLSKIISRALLLTWHRYQLKVISNRNNEHHHEDTWQQIRYTDFRQPNHIESNRHDHNTACSSHFLNE
ncbi:spore protease YyaC [Paenisporosarcina cavernae]|uniref:Spore protease YyaC n=1 Tax=Paenisporosarcina cavernae TaxID=2320858 RepID=A0A385YQW5_9BACL|nr:spore protease YyaC [Paenisporosarcina cavernae]